MLFHNIFLEFDAGEEFNMFIARLIKKIGLSFSTVNYFSGIHAFAFQICMCAHTCARIHAHMSQRMCEVQRTTYKSQLFFHHGVLGIKSRLSSLAVSAFNYWAILWPPLWPPRPPHTHVILC